MSKPLIEALKEFTRTFILGEIPTMIAVLGVIASGIDTTTGVFAITWNVVLAVLVVETISTVKTALMSAADKWLHEKDVKTVLDLKGFDGLGK